MSEDMYVDSFFGMLNNYGVGKSLIIMLFLAICYICYMWYKENTPYRIKSNELKLEGMSIDNKMKARTLFSSSIRYMLKLGYSTIHLKISNEIVRIYTINNISSEERRRQIPIELMTAMHSAVSEAAIILSQFIPHNSDIKLSDVIVTSNQNCFTKDEFWQPILDELYSGDKHALTTVMNVLSAQISQEYEKSLLILTNKTDEKLTNKNKH